MGLYKEIPLSRSAVRVGIELNLEIKGRNADEISMQLNEIGNILDANSRIHKCTVKGTIEGGRK